MRAIAIAIAVLATAAFTPGSPLAKATSHARAAPKPAASPAAGPITADQADAVAELAKTGLSIQAELNNTIASVSDEQVAERRLNANDSVLYIECFQVLEGVTAELTGNLKELMVAASMAHLAKDPADQDAAIRFTRLALEDVDASVAVVEKVVEGPHAPACQSSRLYHSEVGNLQAFAHDVTRTTDDISVATVPQQ